MIEVPPLNSTDMERADANQPAGVLAWNEVVNDMVRLRQAIDPEWVLEEWLESRAAEELRLIEMDLNRELLRLIHRKKRIESIAEDLDHTLEQPKIESGQQTNLFDHFDAILGEGRYERPTAGHIRHGLIDLSPPEADDPMLRVVMRLIQHIVADADARDEIAIHEWIFEETKRQGLEEEEVEIAICNLISSGGLIEIGEGEYILGDE